MKKIPALTIMEICIVMLLSAIVTGIGFTTLDIFQKSLLKFRKESSALADISLFHRLLSHDIWSGSQVLYTEDGIETRSRSGTAVWHFHTKFVIREKAERIDTFGFVTVNRTFAFQQGPVEVQGMLIDQINFDLVYKEEVLPFLFSKKYAADLLIQTDKISQNNGWH